MRQVFLWGEYGRGNNTRVRVLDGEELREALLQSCLAYFVVGLCIHHKPRYFRVLQMLVEAQSVTASERSVWTLMTQI